MSSDTWDTILVIATWAVSSYAVIAFSMLWADRRLPRHHEPRCAKWWTPTHRSDMYPKLILLHGDRDHKADENSQQDEETKEIPCIDEDFDIEVPKQHRPTA